MKIGRLHLESFEANVSHDDRVTMTPAELEEQKLAAFEHGYAAGWDDCSSAREAEEATLRAAIGQSLQNMSFSYHEARHHILNSLSPLIAAIMSKVLPEAARLALPQVVVEQLQSAVNTLSEVPVSVAANPATISAIRDLISDRLKIPTAFITDSNLDEREVYIKFQDSEIRIDIDDVVSRISSTISNYLQSAAQDEING